jgi:hypothetical protein
MSSLLLLCTPAPYRVRLTGRPGLNRSVPAWRPKLVNDNYSMPQCQLKRAMRPVSFLV